MSLTSLTPTKVMKGLASMRMEEYDSQPDHIRAIMREKGCDQYEAKYLYQHDTASSGGNPTVDGL